MGGLHTNGTSFVVRESSDDDNRHAQQHDEHVEDFRYWYVKHLHFHFVCKGSAFFANMQVLCAFAHAIEVSARENQRIR